MNRSVAGRLRLSMPLVAALGCGQVHSDAPADAPVADSPVDAPLGTKDSPARSCAELHVEGLPSAVYWVLGPDTTAPPFQVYCEQQLDGGGWAMVENSVRRADGTTNAFWHIKYADRLKRFGTPATDQNYYDGSLYIIGREYMDAFVDLQGKSQVAAIVTTTGINPATMQFTMPVLVSGNQSVFSAEFASGWSAVDFDGDTSPTTNCAQTYASVTQHYASCWNYNLGADADMPVLDGGVGPHVANTLLTSLGLALQPSGGNYSQVRRIARFTRW